MHLELNGTRSGGLIPDALFLLRSQLLKHDNGSFNPTQLQSQAGNQGIELSQFEHGSFR